MHRFFFFPPICVPHCCLSVFSLALQCISLATKNSHIFSRSVSPPPRHLSARLTENPAIQRPNKSDYRLHPICVKYSKHTRAFNAIKGEAFLLHWNGKRRPKGKSQFKTHHTRTFNLQRRRSVQSIFSLGGGFDIVPSQVWNGCTLLSDPDFLSFS